MVSKKKAKILRCLENNDRPMSPKEIARYTKISIGTVKPYLRQLAEVQEVRQYDKGLYTAITHRISDRGAITEPLNLHGINLMYEYNPKDTPPFLRQAIPVTFTSHRHKINHSIVTDLIYEDRKITITHHEKKGVIMVAVMASNTPFDMESFRRFTAWLNGKFHWILNSQWIIKQIGINWDTKRIRLEGLTSMSLQAFENLWLQIYQKTKNMVRIESHLTTNITLEDALDILISMNKTIDRKIESKM